ncbi:ab-hydrolase associated lipase region [Ancylostoma duodenale]|uniref:Ab-hydrolase associated lipase region n=1 Tax=Ancylostoma duodenale TaxID=51022 RepID=A0A0C2HGI1_9BILA|nr:ab-hydrolase associated lipase region [Ancylostoma duodenale]
MLLYSVLVLANIFNPAHLVRNEETFMKVPQLISHFGYMFEEHYVTTEDGYILTVHRIPVGRDGYFSRSENGGAHWRVPKTLATFRIV